MYTWLFKEEQACLESNFMLIRFPDMQDEMNKQGQMSWREGRKRSEGKFNTFLNSVTGTSRLNIMGSDCRERETSDMWFYNVNNTETEKQ